MARRRKESGADILIELVSMLPWWVGLLLALVMYLVLHHLAVQPSPVGLKPGQIGDFAGKAIMASLAAFLQYLIPLLCIVAAGMAFWKVRDRQQIASTITHSQSASALGDLSWQDFEKLVGEAFRQRGFAVTETGGGGADGGVDLVLSKDGERSLVQCKQWRAYKVGVDVVRELYGVMAAKGAARGYVVTSGTFTDEAKRFAAGRNIHLVDGPELYAMIQQARRPSSHDPSQTPQARSAVPASPPCPVCGSAMLKRTAKKGAMAGNQFWGCSNYPSCKGIRSL